MREFQKLQLEHFRLQFVKTFLHLVFFPRTRVNTQSKVRWQRRNIFFASQGDYGAKRLKFYLSGFQRRAKNAIRLVEW